MKAQPFWSMIVAPSLTSGSGSTGMRPIGWESSPLPFSASHRVSE